MYVNSHIINGIASEKVFQTFGPWTFESYQTDRIFTRHCPSDWHQVALCSTTGGSVFTGVGGEGVTLVQSTIKSLVKLLVKVWGGGGGLPLVPCPVKGAPPKYCLWSWTEGYPLTPGRDKGYTSGRTREHRPPTPLPAPPSPRTGYAEGGTQEDFRGEFNYTFCSRKGVFILFACKNLKSPKTRHWQLSWKLETSNEHFTGPAYCYWLHYQLKTLLDPLQVCQTLDVPKGKKNPYSNLVVKRTGWKTIRIFVSSTFKDFHREREILVKEVSNILLRISFLNFLSLIFKIHHFSVDSVRILIIRNYSSMANSE